MDYSSAIKLRRRWNFFASAREFNVMVDGRRIGIIDPGVEQNFPVESGHHVLFVSTPLGSRSPRVRMDLSSGESRTFECGVSVRLYIQILPLPVLAWCLKLSMPPHGDISGPVSIGLAAALVVAFLYAGLQPFLGEILYLKEAARTP